MRWKISRHGHDPRQIDLLAVLALLVYLCFAHADRVRRLLGNSGTTIALRLAAFILFCIGVQILWSGVAEMLAPWKLH